MSMKRSKQASRSARGRESEDTFWAKSAREPDKAWNWQEHVAGQPDESFVPYALTSKFAKGALVRHPKFGKGVVTQVEGSRIEVLFEDAARKLGHAG
jgi:hypothetical protein